MRTSAASALFITKPRNFVRKPQSGAACGKKATINMCLEVAQHCSTSSTPIYCVGFLLRRFRCATPAVKHSEAPSALSSQYTYNHLIVSDINRLRGQSEWFAMMFWDFSGYFLLSF